MPSLKMVIPKFVILQLLKTYAGMQHSTATAVIKFGIQIHAKGVFELISDMQKQNSDATPSNF